MSWGIRITLLALGFVGFMTYMVVRATQQNFDLVAEDYYGKELAFQKQIDKQKNQESLKEKIQVLTSPEEVIIKFPSEVANKKIKGEIVFFCPSDAKKDITKEISLTEGQQVLSRNVFRSGMYRIKIDYEVEGKGYYYENSIMI